MYYYSTRTKFDNTSTMVGLNLVATYFFKIEYVYFIVGKRHEGEDQQ
eukprot:SAG11_NODE_167_length_13647_cov_7.705049_1_plen_47_part_00